MPISNQYIGSPVEKQWVKIVAVDTRTRRIDAQLKDYGIVQVAVWETAPVFQWPIEGEWWLIVRENGIWHLRAPEKPPEGFELENLGHGDVQLGRGAKIHLIGETHLWGDLLAGDILAEDVTTETLSAEHAAVEDYWGEDITLTGPMTGTDVLTGEDALTDEGHLRVGGTVEFQGTTEIGGSLTYNDSEVLTPDNFHEAIGEPYTTTIVGNGATESFLINHNLGTREVSVTIRELDSPYEHVIARILSTSVDSCTIEVDPALPAGANYVVTVARALGGAVSPPSSPTAHAASHQASGSDPIPLMSQIIEGLGATDPGAVAIGTSGTEWGRAGPGGSDFRLTCSPAIDGWWDVHYFLGQINEPGANAWGYVYLRLFHLGSTIPATSATIAKAPGAEIARAITSTYGPAGPQYTNLTINRRFPVSAGGNYTITPLISCTHTTSTIGTFNAFQFAQGTLWAR